MAKQKKVQQTVVKTVKSSVTKLNLKADSRFKPEGIPGMDGWMLITDTKYSIIYEFKPGNFDKCRQRPLVDYPQNILRQSLIDVQEYISKSIKSNLNLKI
jgi:hypothetical protein